jgi:tetratricopeptide (TPR) repeat protein
MSCNIDILCFSIAYTALEDHESALECYRKALELDPGNQSYQNNLEIAEQKLQEMAAQVIYK